jgi:hypothetical protein
MENTSGKSCERHLLSITPRIFLDCLEAIRTTTIFKKMEKSVMGLAFLKITKFSLTLVAVLVLLETSVLCLHAQVNYGTVRGRIADASGAVIANADVTLTNAGTKITRATHTNQAGDYFFTAVAPGTYTVSISAKNFKNVEHKGNHRRS